LTSLPPLDPKFYTPPFDFVEFVPAIEKAMGISLPDLNDENALPNLITILKLARINIPGGFPATLPKLLDRLSALCLEPLSYKAPLFIIHHPACMSPLSKEFTCPTTGQRVSARAELFVQGRELVNMYEEENNPDEQLRKMVEYRRVSLLARREREERSSVDDNIVEEEDLETPSWAPPSKDQVAAAEESPVNEEDEEPPPPIDQSYIRALRAGLPPTGGWGCGVERLVMLFSGAKRISDVLSFGTLRNVANLNASGETVPDLNISLNKECKVEEDNKKDEDEWNTRRIDSLTKRLTLKTAPPGEES
jgi:lysyl-tRNA synthetase class 2